MNTINISIRVRADLRARIKQHCQERGLKMSDYVGGLIEKDLMRVDNPGDQAQKLREMAKKKVEDDFRFYHP